MARLTLKKIDGTEEYQLDRKMTIGRLPGNDIVIDSGGVSRCHCLIDVDARHVFIKDLGSTNGTYINGEKITEVQVHEHDILRIGREEYIFCASDDFAVEKADRESAFDETSTVWQSPGKKKIDYIFIKPLDSSLKQYLWPVNSLSTIGRSKSNHLRVDDMTVSRNHATIEVHEDRVIISDLSSANGTFVNNTRIHQAELQDGDIFRIATFQFLVTFRTRAEDNPA
jgi:pSer/pThr/pTyr-binding forkhead associated (FHA) protein